MTVRVGSGSFFPLNRNFLGSSAPYVRISAGGVTKRTSVALGAVHPEWNEDLNFGFLGSGSLLTVEIWYAEPDFMFVDRMVSQSHVRVPFCSALNAEYALTQCAGKKPCSSTGSLWKMPSELQCRENGSFSFPSGAACANSSTCLHVAFTVTPFAMKIVDSTNTLKRVPELTAAAFSIPEEPWTFDFGRPFLSSSSSLDLNIREAVAVTGGLMLRISNDDRYVGASNSRLFELSLNFPATVYVCRRVSDNARGVPSWLDAYSKTNISATRLLLLGDSNYFGCFYRRTSGTIMSEFDEVEENSAVPLFANTIHSHDLSEPPFYDSMYVVIALPNVPIHREDGAQLRFSSRSFLTAFASYGVVWLWFTYLAYTYLRKLLFKTDRIANCIRIQGLTPDSSHLLANLFYAESMAAATMKSRLFYATRATELMLVVPLLFVFPFGLCVLDTVTPASLGLAVIFIGLTLLLTLFGFCAWRFNEWRMTSLPIFCFVSSAFLLFVFCLCVLFAESFVDFTGLSLLFGTVNFFLLLPCLCAGDKSRLKANAEILHSLKKASLGMHPEAYSSLQHITRAILGGFTIDTSLPAFKYSHLFFRSCGGVEYFYASSIAVLVLYVVLSSLFTPYSSLSILHAFTLIVFDYIHRSLSHKLVSFSLPNLVLLSATCRLLVMGSSTQNWLAYYSIAYFSYSTVFYISYLNQTLPLQSSSQAYLELFLNIRAEKSENDLSRDPFLASAVLTVYFIWVVLAVDIGSAFPVQYSSYIYPVLGIMAPITLALLTAAGKTIYLDSKSLLRGWFKSGYMVLPYLNVPFIFCVLSELSIVSTGVIVYGLLDAMNVVLLSAVFLPFILLSFLIAGMAWKKNDFMLVRWATSSTESIIPRSVRIPDELNKLEGSDVEAFQDYPEHSELLKFANKEVLATESGLAITAFQLEQQTKTALPQLKKMPKLPVKSALVKEMLKKIDGLPLEEKTHEALHDARKGAANNVYTADDCSESDSEDDDEAVVVPILRSIGRQTAVGKNFFTSVFGSLPIRKRNQVANDEQGDDPLDRHIEMSISRPRSMWVALFCGYLAPYECIGIASFYLGIALLIVYGEVVSFFVQPSFLGHAIWVIALIIVIFAYNLSTYLLSYRASWEARLSYLCILVLHVGLCAFLYMYALEERIHSLRFFWLLDYFIALPVIGILIHHCLILFDEGVFTDASKSHKFRFLLRSFACFACIAFVIYCGVTIQVYFWIDSILGQAMIATGVISMFISAIVYVRSVCSPSRVKLYTKYASRLCFLAIAGGCITGVFRDENPIFVFSVTMFIYFTYRVSLVFLQMQGVHTKIYYLSPWLFPAYSLNVSGNTIADENLVVIDFLCLFIILFLWGCLIIVFVRPIATGLAIVCSVALIAVTSVTYLITRFTQLLDSCSGFLSHEDVAHAAHTAVSTSSSRKYMLSFDADAILPSASAISEEPGQTCRAMIDTLHAHLLRLCYMPPQSSDMSVSLDLESNGVTDDRECMLKHQVHNQAEFTYRDAIAEIFVTSSGPFGFLGCGGVFVYTLRHSFLSRYEPLWLRQYDSTMNRIDAVKLPSFSAMTVSMRIAEADSDVATCFKEEMRLGVHFIFCLTMCLQAKCAQNNIVFQQFFVEYRVKLLSHGIRYPPQLFLNDESSTIVGNIALVWLSSLSVKKRKIFDDYFQSYVEFHSRLMKRREEKEEQILKEECGDSVQRGSVEAVYVASVESLQKQILVSRLKLFAEMAGTESMELAVKSIEWMSTGTLVVPEEDLELYARFFEASKLDDDPLVDTVKFELSEILNSGRNCSEDDNGRPNQFSDPAFSLGKTIAKPSISFCAATSLFNADFDPFDVRFGAYPSEWIVSAVRILAMGLNSQANFLSEMFLPHSDEIGFYAVKLMLNKTWVPVIVDDRLPVQHHSKWTNANRGVAAAHSFECSQLWVSVIEKAFAKVYGGYDKLSGGSLQHALVALTGTKANERTCMYCNKHLCRLGDGEHLRKVEQPRPSFAIVLVQVASMFF